MKKSTLKRDCVNKREVFQLTLSQDTLLVATCCVFGLSLLSHFLDCFDFNGLIHIFNVKFLSFNVKIAHSTFLCEKSTFVMCM